MTNGFITVPRGLAKVIVTDTEIGDVHGDRGYFHYRGRSGVELAAEHGFEAAWHLLVHGDLPGPVELARYRAEAASGRALPDEVASVLPAICATTSDPLQILRTALSLWGSATGLRPLYDCDEEEKAAAARAVVAVTPTILAAAHRLGRGLEPIAPDAGARSRRGLPAHGDRTAPGRA